MGNFSLTVCLKYLSFVAACMANNMHSCSGHIEWNCMKDVSHAFGPVWLNVVWSDHSLHKKVKNLSTTHITDAGWREQTSCWWSSQVHHQDLFFCKENWILNNQNKYIFVSYINCFRTAREKKYWVESSSLWNKNTLK